MRIYQVCNRKFCTTIFRDDVMIGSSCVTTCTFTPLFNGGRECFTRTLEPLLQIFENFCLIIMNVIGKYAHISKVVSKDNKNSETFSKLAVQHHLSFTFNHWPCHCKVTLITWRWRCEPQFESKIDLFSIPSKKSSIKFHEKLQTFPQHFGL